MPFSKVKIDWTYDAPNRLVAETRDANADGVRDSGDCTDTYAFDLNGNHVRKQTGWDANGDGQLGGGEAIDETISFTCNARDHLLTETSTITGPTTYVYNANGSTISKGADTYAWDLRGRMVSAAIGGTTTTYACDHEGVRIGQATGAQSRAFLYDKLNPTGYAKAIEEHVNGSPDRSYVLGLRVEGQWDAAGPAWFIRDGHGSNRLLTDEDGAPVEYYDYAAYGEAVCMLRIDPQTQATTAITADQARTTDLFGGDGVYDVQTGWTYHLARWRDGHRFVSYDSFEADPASPAGLHKYLYANANPVCYVDSRLGARAIVERAFRETTQIEEAQLRRMITYAAKHPDRTIGAFNNAAAKSLGDAAADTLKAFLAAGGIATVTDALADFFVENAKAFAEGLRNMGRLSQERV